MALNMINSELLEREARPSADTLFHQGEYRSGMFSQYCWRLFKTRVRAVVMSDSLPTMPASVLPTLTRR